MSSVISELPNLEQPRKEDVALVKSESGKKTKSLRRPSSIPKGPRSNSQPNTGSQSARAKGDSTENHAVQRPSSRSHSATSSVNTPTNPKTPGASSTLNVSFKRLLNDFLAKKKRYAILKKDITDKHKNVLELYMEILEMRDKVIALGGKDPGKPGEIILNSSPEKNKFLSSTIETKEEAAIEIDSSEISGDFVTTMESKLKIVSNAYMIFCQELLKKRMEIISWRSEGTQNEISNSEEFLNQMKVFRGDDHVLVKKLEITKKNQDQLIEDLVEKSRVLWYSYEKYRVKIKDIVNTGEVQFNERVNSLNEELSAERERADKLNEKKIALENHLQRNKVKMQKLESQASVAEAKVDQLECMIKQLECQVKQKEASLEQRTKEIQKITKSNEHIINKLGKQKENLEARLADLTKELSEKGDSQEKLKTIKLQLENTTQELIQERELRSQLEKNLEESKERYVKLEKKCQELLELSVKQKETQKSNFLTAPDPSSNELKLFHELQEAKITIEKQEERIEQLHRERDDFVAVMKRAANREGGDETNAKMAADILALSNELKILKEENSELKKNYKTTHSKSETLEKQLSLLRARLQAQSKEGGKIGLNAHVIELEQENLDLKCHLTQLSHQVKYLEMELSKKQLEIEFTKQNKSDLTKAKENLMHYMKPARVKEEKEDFHEEYNDVNNFDTRTEQLQEIIATLESKQMQIMQLEKMVKQMEEQQDRAQAQRTRLENRIAQLELAAKDKNQRARGLNIM